MNGGLGATPRADHQTPGADQPRRRRPTPLEAKQLVGVGQARNRHRLAIARTVPFGLCCYSLLIVWYTRNGDATADVTARRAADPWYRHKRTPFTLDMLAA